MKEVMDNLPPIFQRYVLKKGEFKNMKGVAILTFEEDTWMFTTKEHLEREAIIFIPITSIEFLDRGHQQVYVMNTKHYFSRDPDLYLGPIGEYRLTQTIEGEKKGNLMVLSWINGDLAHIITPLEKGK